MILIICGPPASGKSTLAEELRKELSEMGLDFSILHSDDFSRDTYDKMFEEVQDSCEDWILDGTFYKKEFREPFKELDDVKVIYLVAGLETCLQRNQERSKELEDKVIHIIWHGFEEIEADLVIDMDENEGSLTNAVQKIIAFFFDDSGEETK